MQVCKTILEKDSVLLPIQPKIEEEKKPLSIGKRGKGAASTERLEEEVKGQIKRIK